MTYLTLINPCIIGTNGRVVTFDVVEYFMGDVIRYLR